MFVVHSLPMFDMILLS